MVSFVWYARWKYFPCVYVCVAKMWYIIVKRANTLTGYYKPNYLLFPTIKEWFAKDCYQKQFLILTNNPWNTDVLTQLRLNFKNMYEWVLMVRKWASFGHLGFKAGPAQWNMSICEVWRKLLFKVGVTHDANNGLIQYPIWGLTPRVLVLLLRVVFLTFMTSGHTVTDISHLFQVSRLKNERFSQ